MLDSGMVDSTVFAPMVADLTLSFRDDLKRKLSKSASYGSSYDYSEHSSYGGYGYADRKSTRLNSSHGYISYAVFCLKKKINANRAHGLSTDRATIINEGPSESSQIYQGQLLP